MKILFVPFTVMKWMQGCVGRMLHCTPSEIYKMVPIVSKQQCSSVKHCIHASKILTSLLLGVDIM